jgi:glycosyltransferase involved in cell wall biosynthesis
MTSPAVSVLLPVRDGAPFLQEALDSIAAQTLEDFELVAVDDRSSDATPALLSEAARRDSRIRVVQGPGQGIAAALNAGLRECRGGLIARMDADDRSLPDRLARQVAALSADRSLAAVGTQVRLFPRERLTEGLLAYETWLNSLTSKETVRLECFVESPLAHPSAMIRRDALCAIGGYSSAGWPEDYALWLTLLERGHTLSNVPSPLLLWRDHSQRLTRTHEDYSVEAHLRLKAHHLSRGPLREGRCIVWGAGKTGRRLYRALETEGVTVALFVDIDPRKVGQRLHGVPVVAPDDLRAFDGVHLVAAVGARGARARIREFLSTREWTETVHFTCIG